MLGKILAVFFAVAAVVLGGLYLKGRGRMPFEVIRAVESAPKENKQADVSQIAVVSTVISDGVAHIRIRNNNPYPVRGVVMKIDYYPTNKELDVPAYSQDQQLVPALIMPGQEFDFSTMDPRDPSHLVPHGARMPEEWIAIPRLDHADRVK